jgi:hypothetical protein
MAVAWAGRLARDLRGEVDPVGLALREIEHPNVIEVLARLDYERVLIHEVLTRVVPSEDVHLLLDLGGSVRVSWSRFLALKQRLVPRQAFEVEAMNVIEHLFHFEVRCAVVPAEVN